MSVLSKHSVHPLDLCSIVVLSVMLRSLNVGQADNLVLNMFPPGVEKGVVQVAGRTWHPGMSGMEEYCCWVTWLLLGPPDP